MGSVAERHPGYWAGSRRDRRGRCRRRPSTGRPRRDRSRVALRVGAEVGEAVTVVVQAVVAVVHLGEVGGRQALRVGREVRVEVEVVVEAVVAGRVFDRRRGARAAGVGGEVGVAVAVVVQAVVAVGLLGRIAGGEAAVVVRVVDQAVTVVVDTVVAVVLFRPVDRRVALGVGRMVGEGVGVVVDGVAAAGRAEERHPAFRVALRVDPASHHRELAGHDVRDARRLLEDPAREVEAVVALEHGAQVAHPVRRVPQEGAIGQGRVGGGAHHQASVLRDGERAAVDDGRARQGAQLLEGGVAGAHPAHRLEVGGQHAATRQGDGVGVAVADDRGPVGGDGAALGRDHAATGDGRQHVQPGARPVPGVLAVVARVASDDHATVRGGTEGLAGLRWARAGCRGC